MKLGLESNDGKVEMIDFDFFDDIEIVACIKSTSVHGGESIASTLVDWGLLMRRSK